MSIEVSNLDHLGLVAGLVDEIGLVALINEQLGEHSAEKISAGQVVKGMILNGLGLVSSPLYLFSRFPQPPLIKCEEQSVCVKRKSSKFAPVQDALLSPPMSSMRAF